MTTHNILPDGPTINNSRQGRVHPLCVPGTWPDADIANDIVDAYLASHRKPFSPVKFNIMTWQIERDDALIGQQGKALEDYRKIQSLCNEEANDLNALGTPFEEKVAYINHMRSLLFQCHDLYQSPPTHDEIAGDYSDRASASDSWEYDPLQFEDIISGLEGSPGCRFPE